MGCILNLQLFAEATVLLCDIIFTGFFCGQKPRLPHLIFVSYPYFIYVGDPCSNIGNLAIFFERIDLSCNITKFFLQVFLEIAGFAKRFNMILIHYFRLFL